MEGVFRFKSWFLNAPRLIHGGAFFRNFTVFPTGCAYYLPRFIIILQMSHLTYNSWGDVPSLSDASYGPAIITAL